MLIGTFRVEGKNQRFVSPDIVENFLELVEMNEDELSRRVRLNISSLPSALADNIVIGKVYKFELNEVE